MSEPTIPSGPITRPGQDNQNTVLHINEVDGLSITDKLLQIKGKQISTQIDISDVNYFNLIGGKLLVHMGSITFSVNAPQLEVEQLRNSLSPVFNKLNTGQSLICFNQRKVGYYIFNNEERTAMIVFKNAEILRITVSPDQMEGVFTSFAEHHELIIRTRN